MSIAFREAEAEHVPAILEIYRHYVLNTAATFHTIVPALDEMREMVCPDHPIYRTFVIFDDGEVCGYVILDQHKKREAYNETAEVSVYLSPACIGKGIGSAAIKYIEDYARDRGLHVLIATISGENTLSIQAFQRNGFTECARYREVGKKFGRYIDVVAYQKILDR